MENEKSKDEYRKEEEPSEIVGIYRVNPDGGVESLESINFEADEEVSLFHTDRGIVLVSVKVAGSPKSAMA